jgi:Family of unknown function (DUF6151)
MTTAAEAAPRESLRCAPLPGTAPSRRGTAWSPEIWPSRGVSSFQHDPPIAASRVTKGVVLERLRNGAERVGSKELRLMTQIAQDVPLRCRCGHVRGVAKNVEPRAGFRLFCYCRDCQTFARLIERPDMLDPAGGTDMFQMPTGRVQGLPLVHGVLPDTDRQYGRPAVPGCRPHSFLHGPRGGWPVPRRVARPAPLPALRTLRHRAASADGACAALFWSLRFARVNLETAVGTP